jgi:hypothetical protein
VIVEDYAYISLFSMMPASPSGRLVAGAILSLTPAPPTAAYMVQRVHQAHNGAAFAELCQAYDVAIIEWRNELERDVDQAKEQKLEAAFDALRGQIFDYRPASMADVAEKAMFLSTRWNDAEGLNPNRIQQMFVSLVRRRTDRNHSAHETIEPGASRWRAFAIKAYRRLCQRSCDRASSTVLNSSAVARPRQNNVITRWAISSGSSLAGSMRFSLQYASTMAVRMASCSGSTTAL